MNGEDFGILMGLFLLVFFFVMVVVGIVFYIFNAIGLFKLAKREGKEDLAWLAWVPIGNTILMMQLLEGAVHQAIRGKLTLIYGITMALSFILNVLFQLMGLFAILLLPFFFLLQLATPTIFFYGFYFLAKRYSPNAVLHLVIGILTLGLSTCISVFMFRNRDVTDSTGLTMHAVHSEEPIS